MDPDHLWNASYAYFIHRCMNELALDRLEFGVQMINGINAFILSRIKKWFDGLFGESMNPMNQRLYKYLIHSIQKFTFEYKP
jgi:hypothetical protein